MSPTRAPRGEEAAAAAGLTKQDYEALSDFRYRLRCFERFSEHAAHALGVTALQYYLLLHIKGFRGREWAGIGELAERLQAHPHGVVALVSRCEELGLVERRASAGDGRKVEVHLRAKGERLVARLALLHRAEIKLLDEAIPSSFFDR